MTSMADPISAGSPRLPRLLSGAERESAMDRLSVEFNALSSSKRTFLKAAWILRRQGVLVVRQAVTPQALEAINAELNQLLLQTCQLILEHRFHARHVRCWMFIMLVITSFLPLC